MTAEPPASPPALPGDEDAARRKRNVALASALFLFVALVFVMTIVQLYRNTHGLH
jgi:hypothetical protein